MFEHILDIEQFNRNLCYLSEIDDTMKLRADKLVLLADEIDFCGMRLRDGLVSITSHNLREYADFVPESVGQLVSWSCFLNYFSTQLRGAAHSFKALRLLLNGMSKLCQIKWTQELTFHVELLRERLKSAPPLAIVNRNIECQAFSIFADSSSLAIGACLCQNIPVEEETKTSSIAVEKPCPGKKNSKGQDTFLKPIAYFSQLYPKQIKEWTLHLWNFMLPSEV